MTPIDLFTWGGTSSGSSSRYGDSWGVGASHRVPVSMAFLGELNGVLVFEVVAFAPGLRRFQSQSRTVSWFEVDPESPRL